MHDNSQWNSCKVRFLCEGSEGRSRRERRRRDSRSASRRRRRWLEFFSGFDLIRLGQFISDTGFHLSQLETLLRSQIKCSEHQKEGSGVMVEIRDLDGLYGRKSPFEDVIITFSHDSCFCICAWFWLLAFAGKQEVRKHYFGDVYQAGPALHLPWGQNSVLSTAFPKFCIEYSISSAIIRQIQALASWVVWEPARESEEARHLLWNKSCQRYDFNSPKVACTQLFESCYCRASRFQGCLALGVDRGPTWFTCNHRIFILGKGRNITQVLREEAPGIFSFEMFNMELLGWRDSMIRHANLRMIVPAFCRMCISNGQVLQFIAWRDRSCAANSSWGQFLGTADLLADQRELTINIKLKSLQDSGCIFSQAWTKYQKQSKTSKTGCNRS